MRTRLALTLVLLAATGIAPGAAAQESGATVPLVRMRDGHGSDLLFRVHPRTLRPLGRPIRTFRNGAGLAFSPDGRLLAYTDGSRFRSRIHSSTWRAGVRWAWRGSGAGDRLESAGSARTACWR